VTGEIGQLSLCLALALAFVQSFSGLIGARANAASSRAIASGAALGMFVFVALAFFALMYGFVASDFSIADVAQNSTTTKPLIYKITGVWGNHEGSMLLWVFVLSVYSCAVALAQRGGGRMTAAALGVQGLLAAAFLLFILLTSDPFLRIDPQPFEGAGLNPLLQDPGLAFHPPMLYLGYVGLSASFAYAAAALIVGDPEGSWARAARPFLLIAWIALTLGITLGSWWAYYELGWGGFWFWDPVENASLMPWLVATALLHSALATERTGAFRTWSLLLAITAFSMSLIGTFLVRSGVLTSVHSFANDPERGNFILMMLAAAIGGALALFAWRAPSLRSGASFEPASRETALLLNNLFLVAATATVFLGTLYPLGLDALTGEKISVGPPYFALTFAPIFVALLAVLPFGPRLPWRHGNLREALRILAPGLGAAAAAAVIVFFVATPQSLAVAGAFGLAAWLIAASAIDVFRLRRSGALFKAGAFASALAHAGLGVTLIGVAGITAWRSEAVNVLKPGQQMQIADYTLQLDGVERVATPSYFANRATIEVISDGHVLATMFPQVRQYPAEGQATTETAIRTTGFEDLYVALGDERSSGTWVVRAYVNPLAPFIWFGGAIMAFGGGLSLFGRLRKTKAAPAVSTVAAE
jgi:cytochrome c-type biogenesis protein CcmF